MKQIFPLIALLFLLISCSDSSKVTDQDEPVTINVDISKIESDSLNLSEIAYKVEYIPLQTTDSVLIADVFNLKVVHNNYFIESNDLVYRFDGNGNYLNKVYNLGKGPKETDPICFTVSETDSSVYVYGRDKSMKTYSYSGDYKKTIKNPFQKVKSSPFYNLSFFNKYLFIPISQLPSVKYIYSCYDFKQDSLIILCPNTRQYNKSQINQYPVMIPPDHHYQIQESYLLYKENYCDTIYCVDTNFNQSPKYIVNLAKDKLQWETWRDNSMFQMPDAPLAGYGVQSFVETKSNLLLHITSLKDLDLVGVYKRSDHSIKLYQVNGNEHPKTHQMLQVYLRNDLDGIISFPLTHSPFGQIDGYFNSYEGCLYVIINAMNFAEAYSRASEKAKESSEYLKRMDPLFRTLTEESNPVIAKVYLK